MKNNFYITKENQTNIYLKILIKLEKNLLTLRFLY